MKKDFPGAGRFDSINSTVRHQINLCNGLVLKGYSKPLFQAEAQDKTVMLEKMIYRIVKCGYLDPSRTKYIEYYRQGLQRMNEKLMLVLYPTRFAYGNDEDIIKNERLHHFLTNLYKQLEAGYIHPSKLIHKPKYVEEDNVFSLQYKRFKTDGELMEFCIKKMKEGHAEGQVMHFFYQYKNKFLLEIH